MADTPADESHPQDELDIETLDFEAAATHLERIIDDLEGGEVPLERSLEAYDRGRRLVARCRTILDRAAERMREVELDSPDEVDA